MWYDSFGCADLPNDHRKLEHAETYKSKSDSFTPHKNV